MSEKYKIEMSIKAKEDIKDLLIYIKSELNEPTIASKYSKIIKEELKTLTYLPQKFAIIDDETIKDLEIRKLNIKNHIAFYRINEDRKIVNVERILYSGSDWINKL